MHQSTKVTTLEERFAHISKPSLEKVSNTRLRLQSLMNVAECFKDNKSSTKLNLIEKNHFPSSLNVLEE